MKSELIELEREISSHIRSSAHATGPRRTRLARSFTRLTGASANWTKPLADTARVAQAYKQESIEFLAGSKTRLVEKARSAIAYWKKLIPHATRPPRRPPKQHRTRRTVEMTRGASPTAARGYKQQARRRKFDITDTAPSAPQALKPESEKRPIDITDPAHPVPRIDITDPAHPVPRIYKRPVITDTVETKRRGVGKTRAAITYWRKLITGSPQPAARGYKQPIIKRKFESQGETIGKRRLGAFVISICFSLLVLCGIMIAVLFQKIQSMGVEIALWKQHLAAAQANLSQLDQFVQQKNIQEAKIPEVAPRHRPITLAEDDRKSIRAFIKVLPSEPGAQPQIHVGDEISDDIAVPVPESLISQIPKLRGAKFFVDQNGAIIVIGEGSKRADAVVDPQ